MNTLPELVPRRLEGPLIWSAVNFSEGRREDVIGAILKAISSVRGAALADWSADFDHNRMVATVLGQPGAVIDAAAAAFEQAVGLIDLREHTGVHPRAGAVDVIPLVPVRNVTLDECVEVSLRLGEALARRHDIPVYLYERSARPGGRVSLPEIRRGGFEGLFREPLTGDRAPDFGPPTPHPTAGITILGARTPLVAYNVNLASGDVAAARDISAEIRRQRESNPVLAGVRALGLDLPRGGIVQVSMNLTLPALTPIPAVFEFVRQRAEERGLHVQESEIIGLVPREALGGAAADDILWRGFHERQILENWL